MKVAKAAKAAGQAAGNAQADEKKKQQRRIIILVALLSSGNVLPVTGLILILMVLLTSLLGAIGGGAAAAACGEYADNANSGNTSPAAATNPIMPAGKVYMPSTTARNEIPPRMILAAMRGAAHYEGLDWTLIAGQMYQETKYGQDKSAAPGGKNSAGYMGILQFGTPAWTDYGADGNDDGEQDLYNVDDAAFAAAKYLHAQKAETNAAEALRVYSGSTTSNTIYLRVVLTQAARYRGVLTGDKELIKRWYKHLATTIGKNPDFPTLGKQSDIPEPVGNNAQISQATSIGSQPARSWSTPPLDDEGSRKTSARAASAVGVAGDSDAGNFPAMTSAAFSKPLAAPKAPRAPADPKGENGKDWQWPMKKGSYQIGTPYHKNGGMWSLGYHTGLDLVASSGTPIFAPADGKVIKAAGGGSYGNETNLKHAGGVVTLYAHQTKMLVSAGQSVKRGQQIGTVGATGNVTGPHLHWEVRVPGVDNPFVSGQDNGPGMVDPADWLNGKVSANPDYGSVPGGADGKAKDAQYADCAARAGGPQVAPDGAGASGVLPSSDDPVVRAALGWAQRGIGVPYVLGAPRLAGESPSSFDCSSFVQWAYYQASSGKINITGATFSQEPYLKKYKISLSEAQPGDLIYFNPSQRGSEHVGMVWDPKGHKIIHAPRPGKSVEFSKWDVQGKITAVYRVPIPQGANAVEGDGKSGKEKGA
ncbi:peptidoglycan DD-metalloendopeptidase family protein [Streptomyces sp. H27-C3]|uniref:peptidoglycan DD-metalloendopeptidase family protein n=1 Tax=Streptomyces sp. H27-C3 TaxID=3046305 RepID=UPI0024B9649D|nr:peptidoglycan DD-metalloendopeptidase family protein [Streptomyces sp. H27-C3]MDJ0464297.1 peptidoglycan DD-metalloendopeptidase family protein [Streptomyces sp. H27-C3]